MEFCIVFITTENKKEADKISNFLVKKELAACVNIIDNIKSIYRWNNEIQRDKEYLLIVKTRNSLLSKLMKEVKEIHTYSCPEIISLPIQEGNPDYLRWIKDETK